jgi:hypothetical protein
MNSTHLLVAALLVAASSAGMAQSAPAASAASMPMDCSKMMAKHNDASAKGMPMTMGAGCDKAATPAAAASTAKKKAPTHDHGKVHKQQ